MTDEVVENIDPEPKPEPEPVPAPEYEPRNDVVTDENGAGEAPAGVQP